MRISFELTISSLNFLLDVRVSQGDRRVLRRVCFLLRNFVCLLTLGLLGDYFIRIIVKIDLFNVLDGEALCRLF